MIHPEDQRHQPCTKLICGKPCGVPSHELMGLAIAMDHEMHSVPRDQRPWQARCDLGHTMSYNIVAPIQGDAPDDGRCKTHRIPKTSGGCTKCQERARTRRATSVIMATCEGCDEQFETEPTKGARSPYCKTCREQLGLVPA